MSQNPMIIAIDGPAGAGKSTVTRQVAKTLGILFLDTGAMYRAATVGLYDAGINPDDAEAIAAYVCERDISFDSTGQVLLDGVGLGERIRTPEITAEIWRVANNPGCRGHLVDLQQAIVRGRDAALEGRDATTVICPNAGLKVYLDASPEERARRRVAEWGDMDDAPSIEQVAADIRKRDESDMNREVGALQQAPDAVHCITDGMSPQAVIAKIIAWAVKRRPLLLDSVYADQLLVGRSREPGYVKVAQGSVSNPPAPWQLGFTNPTPQRLPGQVTHYARNAGGRQAGVLCQGRAVIVLAGTEDTPTLPIALPMLPQTWYVIEEGVWHAVVQESGTICAWAEASGLTEDAYELDDCAREVVNTYLSVYQPEDS